MGVLPGHPGGHDITLAARPPRLQLVINHGASFGLGSGFEPVLTVLSLVIVALLWLWAVRSSSRAERLGAALAAAGGAGNVVDRLIRPPAVLHGGVVDWLHVSFYGPTFNLADVMLRGGVVVAAVAWLLGQRTAKAATASAGPGPVPHASMLAAVNPANPPDPDRAEEPRDPVEEPRGHRCRLGRGARAQRRRPVLPRPAAPLGLGLGARPRCRRLPRRRRRRPGRRA